MGSNVYMKTNIYIKLLSILLSFTAVIISYKIIYSKFTEGFTPKIRQMYRPVIRNVNNKIETFMANYNMDILTNKLKKWNIYFLE